MLRSHRGSVTPSARPVLAHRAPMRFAVLLPVLGLLTGCPDRTISEVIPDQNKVESKDIPVNINRNIDILFLIDKSPTMADEQASLTANFPKFMQVLSQIEGGLPNVHIGVISQDIGAGGMTVGGNCSGQGDNGNLLATARIPGCTPPNGVFISDIDPGGGAPRVKNYTDTLESTFSCIASLGPVGCGFEQHLGSLKRALDHNPANAGFLRTDALLAVIIISDEDDCSASSPHIYDPSPQFTGELGAFADFRCFEWGWECDEGTMTRSAAGYHHCHPRTSSPYLSHPDEFVQFLKTVKADPKQIVVATMTGPNALSDPAVVDTTVTIDPTRGVPVVSPSCVNGSQNAFPMPRISYFASQFPDRNQFYSLCNNDLGTGLTLIAQLIRRVVGNPCFESDLVTDDIDPTNPGTQLQCTVSDVTRPGSANPVETILPACKMANDTTPAANTPQPCWYVKTDAVKCATYPTQLTLAIHPEQRTTPPDTHVLVQCVAKG